MSAPREWLEFLEDFRNHGDMLDHLGFESQVQTLQQLAKLLAVDQLDLRSTIASCLGFRIRGEVTGW
jgi:hypothetical protein